MPLQEEIDKTRQEIRTDDYSMSIGEWMSLYQSNESVFLTEEMRKMALNQNLDYSHIEMAFKRTFDILNQTTGDNSFKRYKSEQDRFLGGFLLSAFEVIALGIGYNYQSYQNYQNIPATNRCRLSVSAAAKEG